LTPIHPTTVDIEKASSESYDCVVVLSCLASVVESMSGEPIDLMMGALEKSGKDVQKGVR
jgi:hypothetical protein